MQKKEIAGADSSPNDGPMTREEENGPPPPDSIEGGFGVDAEQRSARIKGLRRALGLTQEEFCRRFGIPLGTLRDWEQGRSEPDKPAKAYLRAIAGDADAVSRALKSEVACGRPA